jgi:TolA-binding protein
LSQRNILNKAKYEKSIQNLLSIIKKCAQSGLASEALYFLGDIYHFKVKDYRKAMDEYQNLIQKFPQNRFVANGQFKIAECCRKLEMWKETIKAYRKFVKDYSQYGYSDYAQFYIGQCYEELKEWQKARDAYSSISTSYPESVWTDVALKRVKYLNRYLGG